MGERPIAKAGGSFGSLVLLVQTCWRVGSVMPWPPLASLSGREVGVGCCGHDEGVDQSQEIWSRASGNGRTCEEV